MSKKNYILSFKTPEASSFSFMHDPSAVLAEDGKIIAGVEEERLIRIKHAPNSFPVESIKYCLSKANIDFSDINKIIIPDNPNLYRKDFYSFKNFNRIRYRLFLSKNYKDESLSSYTTSSLKMSNRNCRKLILSKLEQYFLDQDFPDIEFLDHHLCHAASCFYPSGFEDATTITFDGVGDLDSTVIWSCDENQIKREKTWKIDNSLGHFYGLFTELLGYKFCNGEAKVMGLAPYGKKNKDIFDVFKKIIKTDDDGYDVTEISIPIFLGIEAGMKRIEDLFDIKRRQPNEEFTQDHKDLAFALQFFLEKICVNLVRQAINLTGSSKVCLTGGVALNCKMNKKIMEMPEVDEIFIQPVANDAGCAIGAVLEASKRAGFNVKFKMNNNYFGPEYDNLTVENELKNKNINYSKFAGLKPIAQAIADGKFVGWFQGPMEMGPRALGNRSILADPRSNDIKDKLNDFVKHREKWRPFGPSILEDYASEYIKNYSFAPFMIKTFNIKEKYILNVEGIVHPADKTTRPHVVYKDVNPRYYSLIDEFRKLTGIPLILNTSFNDHGEPIVCSPNDAIDTFLKTGLNILIINDFIIIK